MKYFIVLISALFYVATNTDASVLPDYVKELLCYRWDKNYQECSQKSLVKSREFITTGIPELGIPPIDPLEVPTFSVNQSLNELVNIQSVLSNIRVTGFKDVIIDYYKEDPVKLTGEIRATVPFMHVEMNYDVGGQLLVIPLRSKGYFEGNFTDLKVYSRGSLKLIEKNNEQFYQVKKLQMKMRVGDGHIQLTADNPQLQFGADLIANYYNDNPREVMDAINPIFVETSVNLFRDALNDILGRVPAKEWFLEEQQAEQ